MLITIDVPEGQTCLAFRLAALLWRANPTMLENIDVGISYLEKLVIPTDDV